MAGLATVLLTMVGLAPAARAQSVPPPAAHVPPVAAPVSDGFRAPITIWGAGNRGLEYDTSPGDPVAASADGQVVFAGRVADGLHVTIAHGDGLRTSYSFLAEITVTVGRRVHQGDQVGVAGDSFHFGARLDDRYIDPATLFGGSVVEVELLPFEIPPGASPDDERTAFMNRTTALSEGGTAVGVTPATRWLQRQAALSVHYGLELDPTLRGLRMTSDIVRRQMFPPLCTDEPAPTHPAAAAAGRPRVAVLVGGLGSSSTSASIDRLRTDELGYDHDGVVRFSYAGGRTPDSGQAFVGLEARAYRSTDTQGDVRASATRLADAIEAVAVERPDAVVDVYAHSMGGLVTRLALFELERRGVDLDRLGLVATLGSPHRGADLATAVAAANTGLTGNVGADVLSDRLGTGLDPDAPAIAQLSETSDVVDDLERRGVPDGVELVSVAARGDFVVPSPDTEVDGARNVTVPVTGRQAHSDLVASDAATDELALALAGRPRRCESDLDLVRDEMLGHGLSYVEDLGGGALLGLAP